MINKIDNVINNEITIGYDSLYYTITICQYLNVVMFVYVRKQL